jgi:hypothetical protein
MQAESRRFAQEVSGLRSIDGSRRAAGTKSVDHQYFVGPCEQRDGIEHGDSDLSDQNSGLRPSAQSLDGVDAHSIVGHEDVTNAENQ